MIPAGAPQGATLGPLLFLIYIKGVVFWTLYFDDTVFYLRRNNNVVMEKERYWLRKQDEHALALQQCLPIVY